MARATTISGIHFVPRGSRNGHFRAETPDGTTWVVDRVGNGWTVAGAGAIDVEAVTVPTMTAAAQRIFAHTHPTPEECEESWTVSRRGTAWFVTDANGSVRGFASPQKAMQFMERPWSKF
jgi:hypothetical protein